MYVHISNIHSGGGGGEGGDRCGRYFGMYSAIMMAVFPFLLLECIA